jgi:hypothetical protein
MYGEVDFATFLLEPTYFIEKLVSIVNDTPNDASSRFATRFLDRVGIAAALLSRRAEQNSVARLGSYKRYMLELTIYSRSDISGQPGNLPAMGEDIKVTASLSAVTTHRLSIFFFYWPKA